MASFENPIQLETPEVLYQKAKEAIIKDQSPEESLGEEALEALLAWQEAAEKEADVKNSSIANTEVMIARAKLFIEGQKFTLAQIDIQDALLAGENDESFPKEQFEDIEALKREIEEKLDK